MLAVVERTPEECMQPQCKPEPLEDLNLGQSQFHSKRERDMYQRSDRLQPQRAALQVVQ